MYKNARYIKLSLEFYLRI